MTNKGDEMTVINEPNTCIEQAQGEVTELRNHNVIDRGLQRGLKSRHLQMIALGGVIGYGQVLYSTTNTGADL